MYILTGKSFKCDLEYLDSTSEEFILVKEFYDITSENVFHKIINKTSLCNEYENKIMADFPQNKIMAYFHIFKVNENNPTKAVNEKRNNLMLFHGTDKKSATGILKKGFKNSKRGWFGQGVYLTDCSYKAQEYCTKSYKFDNPDISYSFIFVNEVLCSESLQTFEYDRIAERQVIDTELNNPINKHTSKRSQRLTKDNYKNDLQRRQYRNSAVDHISSLDEYVADESVTIPSYLIVIEQE